jgi:hypothetical protein
VGVPQCRHGAVRSLLGVKPGRGSPQRSLKDQSKVFINNNPPDLDLPQAERYLCAIAVKSSPNRQKKAANVMQGKAAGRRNDNPSVHRLSAQTLRAGHPAPLRSWEQKASRREMGDRRG